VSALSERIAKANKGRGLNSRKVEAAAKAAGFTLSNGTAYKVLTGTHGTVSNDTLHALEYVFGVPFEELSGLVGVSGVDEPWSPPEASARLTTQQRELLDALIHQLVRPVEREAGSEHGDSFDEKSLSEVTATGDMFPKKGTQTHKPRKSKPNAPPT
jgi:hypothetical protein